MVARNGTRFHKVIMILICNLCLSANENLNDDKTIDGTALFNETLDSSLSKSDISEYFDKKLNLELNLYRKKRLVVKNEASELNNTESLIVDPDNKSLKNEINDKDKMVSNRSDIDFARMIADDENKTVDYNYTDCVGQEEYCNMTEKEYIDMLNEYIFPQPYEWVLITTHAIVFLIGLIGNALVCIAVYRNHSMRTVTNYFIVNLAVADFMVILICLPPTVLWDVTETWFFGTAMCRIVLYFQVSLIPSITTDIINVKVCLSVSYLLTQQPQHRFG